MTWEGFAGVTDPGDYNLFTVPDLVADGDPGRRSTTPPTPRAAAAPAGGAPGRRAQFPPDYPKMPGEPPQVQLSKKVAEHWDEDGNRVE